MYLKFKNIRLVETKHGNDLVIKQVELREDSGKFIMHPKLTKELMQAVHEGKMVVNLIDKP